MILFLCPVSLEMEWRCWALPSWSLVSDVSPALAHLGLGGGRGKVQMSSAMAGENPSNTAGSQAGHIFITGHREFPDQGINTISLFMVGQRQGWQLVAAELEGSCRHFLCDRALTLSLSPLP